MFMVAKDKSGLSSKETGISGIPPAVTGIVSGIPPLVSSDSYTSQEQEELNYQDIKNKIRPLSKF